MTETKTTFDTENRERTGEEGLSNSKKRDSSSKLIFGDNTLCAQFLRGYTNIPQLQNVQPEDIEDVSERYVHMFTEERNSDVVKKVKLHDDEMPFYLISLIEHKSEVDYNVVMQILRYMAFIWEVSTEYIKTVTGNAPEYLLRLMAEVISGLLVKLNLSQEEVDDFVGQIRERKMGDWCSHFKGYDVPAMRIKIREEVREEDYKIFIETFKELNLAREIVIEKLEGKYSLTQKEAEEKAVRYW